MIQEFIKARVDDMTANGDAFSFLHGEKDFQNLVADEKVFPAVFLDMPVKYTPTVLNGGAWERKYTGVLLFLYKSNLADDDHTDRYETFLKAEAAQRNFQLLLEASLDDWDDNLKAYTVGECYQVKNLYDCNLDGVIMPFTITPRRFESVCLPVS